MGGSGFANVLDQCLGIRPGEQVVLLTDGGTDAEVVTRLLEAVAARDGIPLVAQMPAPHLPGAEPPGAVAAMMAEAAAIIELTSLFIGSSRARRNATERGVRYLAMPGVVLDTFRAGGPLDVDFEQLRSDAEHVGRAWGTARDFRLTTRGGTDLRGSVADRPGRVLHEEFVDLPRPRAANDARVAALSTGIARRIASEVEKVAREEADDAWVAPGPRGSGNPRRAVGRGR